MSAEAKAYLAAQGDVEGQLASALRTAVSEEAPNCLKRVAELLMQGAAASGGSTDGLMQGAAADARADIGLIGLAVMGQNLILNMDEHGFTVAAFNRTVSKVDDFLANEAKGTKIIGAKSIKELMECLKKPRRVVMLVKAGQAVDDFIETILPFTEEGDIIIDGGNSLFTDSIRRTHYLESKKRLFIGAGVSGGEEGARNGPSLMPGGSVDAWPHVKEIMQSISAKAGANEPCCQWVGGTGSGHYVKMVHNGIEYGDMQLTCEAYHLMKDLLGMGCDEMGAQPAE